jgi:hypothetical protein
MQTRSEGGHLNMSRSRRNGEMFPASGSVMHVSCKGEWDFRDFSRLPPAEANRAQPADPTAASLFYCVLEVNPHSPEIRET